MPITWSPLFKFLDPPLIKGQYVYYREHKAPCALDDIPFSEWTKYLKMVFLKLESSCLDSAMLHLLW